MNKKRSRTFTLAKLKGKNMKIIALGNRDKHLPRRTWRWVRGSFRTDVASRTLVSIAAYGALRTKVTIRTQSGWRGQSTAVTV